MVLQIHDLSVSPSKFFSFQNDLPSQWTCQPKGWRFSIDLLRVKRKWKSFSGKNVLGAEDLFRLGVEDGKRTIKYSACACVACYKRCEELCR
jgi:hypothetical protein